MVLHTLAPALLGLLASDSTVIDVAAEYGNVTFQSIRGAMQRARQIVGPGGGGSATVFVRAGSHLVDMSGGNLFDVSGIVPAAGHRLIVAGAGMHETTIVTRTRGNDVIHANYPAPAYPKAQGGAAPSTWQRVSFVNMTFARPGQSTTGRAQK